MQGVRRRPEAQRPERRESREAENERGGKDDVCVCVVCVCVCWRAEE